MPRTKLGQEPELDVLFPIFNDVESESWILEILQLEIMPVSFYDLNIDQGEMLVETCDVINFQSQVITHVLYKKKWNPSFKVPKRLFELFEPDADYIWSILNLTLEVNLISPASTALWGSTNYWFNQIIQEQKRAEMFSVLNKLVGTNSFAPEVPVEIKGLSVDENIQLRREYLDLLKDEKNPFNPYDLPAFSCLIDTSLQIYRTLKYPEFNRKIWYGTRTTSPYEAKGFLQAYSQVTQSMKEKGHYAGAFKNGLLHYRGSGNRLHPMPKLQKMSIGLLL